MDHFVLSRVSYFGSRVSAAVTLTLVALPVIAGMVVVMRRRGTTRWTARTLSWMGVVLAVAYVWIFTLAPFGNRAGDRPRRELELGFPTSWDEVVGSVGRAMVLNVVLFVPLGLALGYDRHRRTAVCVAVAASLSVAVECLQWVLNRGSTTLADVLTNTLGAWIGAVLAARLVRVRAHTASG